MGVEHRGSRKIGFLLGDYEEEVVVVEEEEDSGLCCHPGHLDQEVVVEVLDEGSYYHNLF